MVNYAEFKGGSSLSQPKKSFEKQLGVCLVGSAGKGILGRGNHQRREKLGKAEGSSGGSVWNELPTECRAQTGCVQLVPG